MGLEGQELIFVDYYRLLGLYAIAEIGVIEDAYTKCLDLQPEKKTGEDYYEWLVGLNIARMILTNPVSKAMYDVDYQLAQNRQGLIKPEIKQPEQEVTPFLMEEAKTPVQKRRGFYRNLLHKSKMPELNRLIEEAYHKVLAGLFNQKKGL